MTLEIGFRGQLFDDDVPLYLQATDGWVYNRLSGQWITAASLSAAMTAEGHVPVFSTVAGAVAEVGVPSLAWQDENHVHEFWGQQAGGRDWGDAGVVFPSAVGGDNVDPQPNPIMGPYDMGDGRYFWINSSNCMIGFDLDGDGDADDWHTGQDVCESSIGDNAKVMINTKLVECGCEPMMCITPAGKLKKAYTLAVLEGGETE